MSSLLIKDLSTQFKYIVTILLLFTSFSFMSGAPGHVFASVGLVMIAMRLAYLEEKNNTLLLLKTMPVKATTVVLSKYLAEFIYGLSFLVIGIPMSLLVNDTGMAGVIGLIMVVSVGFLLSGVMYVFYFKYGYMKASTYLRIGLIVVFMVCMLPVFSTNLQAILIRLGNRIPFTWVTGVCIEVAVLAFYFLTALLAARFYETRENY